MPGGENVSHSHTASTGGSAPQTQPGSVVGSRQESRQESRQGSQQGSRQSSRRGSANEVHPSVTTVAHASVGVGSNASTSASYSPTGTPITFHVVCTGDVAQLKSPNAGTHSYILTVLYIYILTSGEKYPTKANLV